MTVMPSSSVHYRCRSKMPSECSSTNVALNLFQNIMVQPGTIFDSLKSRQLQGFYQFGQR